MINLVTKIRLNSAFSLGGRGCEAGILRTKNHARFLVIFAELFGEMAKFHFFEVFLQASCCSNSNALSLLNYPPKYFEKRQSSSLLVCKADRQELL